MQAIKLIYGERVLDDLEFCSQHEEIIEHYSHGIMTISPAPRKTLEAVALDPASIPGWTHWLESHPQDRKVLQEFFTRLIRHYDEIGRWGPTKTDG
jgi:hypothetical protein